MVVFKLAAQCATLYIFRHCDRIDLIFFRSYKKKSVCDRKVAEKLDVQRWRLSKLLSTLFWEMSVELCVHFKGLETAIALQ